MLIDLHIHEKQFSKDSFLALEEIVEIAKEKGLDAICITDHDSMGLREYAAEYTKKTGFPIFVGIEFYSLQGDILAFGIDSYPYIMPVIDPVIAPIVSVSFPRLIAPIIDSL